MLREVIYHLSVNSALTGSPGHYLECQRLYLTSFIRNKNLHSQLQATKHITGSSNQCCSYPIEEIKCHEVSFIIGAGKIVLPMVHNSIKRGEGERGG